MYKRAYKRKTKELAYSFDNREYMEFLSRLQGCLVFKGKRALSYKWMDKIFYKFKRTFGIDTDFLFKRTLRNITPFIGYRKVKMGKKVNPLPILLRRSKRHVLAINWLLKDVKNKSNVRGYKFKDVWENFYDGIYNKGSIAEKKDDYFDKSLDFLYLLKKRGRRRSALHFDYSFMPKHDEKNLDEPDKNYSKNKEPSVDEAYVGESSHIVDSRLLYDLLRKHTDVSKQFVHTFMFNKKLKSKVRSLWINDQDKEFSLEEKSTAVLDFLYENQRYFKWFKLKKSELFLKYAKKRAFLAKQMRRRNKWKRNQH